MFRQRNRRRTLCILLSAGMLCSQTMPAFAEQAEDELFFTEDAYEEEFFDADSGDLSDDWETMSMEEDDPGVILEETDMYMPQNQETQDSDDVSLYGTDDEDVWDGLFEEMETESVTESETEDVWDMTGLLLTAAEEIRDPETRIQETGTETETGNENVPETAEEEGMTNSADTFPAEDGLFTEEGDASSPQAPEGLEPEQLDQISEDQQQTQPAETQTLQPEDQDISAEPSTESLTEEEIFEETEDFEEDEQEEFADETYEEFEDGEYEDYESIEEITEEITEAPEEAETDELPEEISEVTEELAAGEASCGKAASWKLENGILTISGSGKMDDYDTKNHPGWYDNRSSIKSVVIANGITSIGKMAFEGCRNLASIQIPASVSTLGEAAFYQCTSLKSIVLPSAVTALPRGAFAECTGLQSVEMPGVASIEDYALQGAVIDTFHVGVKLTELTELALFDTKISRFEVAAGNPVYSSVNGVLFTDGGRTLKMFPSACKDTAYTVPAGVTKIAGCAFAKNSSLVSLTIPEGVTELGESACLEMSALAQIRIPDSVTKAGYFTFYKCTALKKVVFGKGLKKTSYEMFEYCTSLQEISYGGLTSLDARTFSYCSALRRVALPASIKEIGNGCFGECSSLESFSCESLEGIPYQTFFNDTKLTMVSFGKSMRNIYRQAFVGCTGLTTVSIPASVTFIAPDAFPETTRIICENPNMGAFGENGYRILYTAEVKASRNYDFAWQVLSLVNEQRAKANLSPLHMEETLLESAMQRAVETSVLFSHTRPDGSGCMSINSLMSGENIAAGSSTPSAVMNQWMNSSGHKENILRKEFGTIGIGCVAVNGIYYWTQCFGTGQSEKNCAKPAGCTVIQDVNMATESFSEAPTTNGIIWGGLENYTYTLDVNVASLIEAGKTADISVKLKNPKFSATIDCRKEDIVLTVSDPSIAVISNGKLKALKAGTVQVKAELKGGYYTGSRTVTVTAVKENLTGTRKNKNGKVTIVKDQPDNRKSGKDSSKTGKTDTNKKSGAGSKSAAKGDKGKTKKATALKKATVSLLKAKKGKKAVVKWKKSTGADYYQIQYSYSSSMKNPVTRKVSASRKSLTLKKLKAGKTIYVRVRACAKPGNAKKTSKWSNVKKVKVKK